MKGFLKGLIYEETPEDDNFLADKAPDKATAIASVLPAKGFSTPTGPAVPSTVNYSRPSGSVPTSNDTELIKTKLLESLAEATKGSPFASYKKMNDGLKARITDIGSRVIASAATLEMQGISKDQITSSITDALTFLDSEHNSFESECVADLQTADTELKRVTEQVLNAIADKEEEIKTLQQEITDARQNKLDFETRTAQEKGSIELSRIQFQSAIAQVKGDVQNDNKEIALYLGGK